MFLIRCKETIPWKTKCFLRTYHFDWSTRIQGCKARICGGLHLAIVSVLLKTPALYSKRHKNSTMSYNSTIIVHKQTPWHARGIMSYSSIIFSKGVWRSRMLVQFLDYSFRFWRRPKIFTKSMLTVMIIFIASLYSAYFCSWSR